MLWPTYLPDHHSVFLATLPNLLPPITTNTWPPWTLHSDKGINPRGGYNNPKYASNTVAPKYIKQLLMGMKGEIHKKIILGDFNTSLTSMDRSSRQKIRK